MLLSGRKFLLWSLRLISHICSLRSKSAAITDTRLRTMNEVITGIRTIKMYAWEKLFAELTPTCQLTSRASQRDASPTYWCQALPEECSVPSCWGRPGSPMQGQLVCVQSRFSRVWFFATPWTAAYQGPLSLGFSRQEYWNGLPCPLPGDLPDPGIKPTVFFISCIGRWVLFKTIKYVVKKFIERNRRTWNW